MPGHRRRWAVTTSVMLISAVAYVDRVNLSVAAPVLTPEFPGRGCCFILPPVPLPVRRAAQPGGVGGPSGGASRRNRRLARARERVARRSARASSTAPGGYPNFVARRSVDSCRNTKV